MTGWNGFCGKCGLAVAKYTIDTVNIGGERRTVLLCQRCWIAIRHPERVQKPKEPTTIVANTSVKEEKHTIQTAEDDPYKKVEGQIKTVEKDDEKYEEKVKEVKE